MWIRDRYGTIPGERLSPPVASRLSAYASVALYAGLAGEDPTMAPLATVLPAGPALPAEATRPDGDDHPDGTLVAVAAEHALLDALLAEGLPTTRAAVARLADSLEAARRAQGVSAHP